MGIVLFAIVTWIFTFLLIASLIVIVDSMILKITPTEFVKTVLRW